jgi:hypothetical protein
MRVEDGSVRLIAGSGVLAVYVSVLHPAGLLDESPTVLGLRTFAITATDDFDAVVPVRSLMMRVEGLLESSTMDVAAAIELTLPLEVSTVTWAAISPPRGSWAPLQSVPGSQLELVARRGIEAVAKAVPGEVGEQIVRNVRNEVWGRPIDGLEFVPQGAAFGAFGLGFLGEGDTVAIYESGAWTRLTTKRGHVLVKRRGWKLAR